MKVMLGHCFYRSSAPSGEDAVFRNEKMLLENHMDIVPIELFNDDIDENGIGGKVKIALQGVWSKQSYRRVAEAIEHFKPDIAHFHNTFPQLSPSVFAACHDKQIPVVVTLHNYRFICPNALLLREGKVCEECLSGSLLPAMKYRCYRGSVFATGAQCLTIATNRKLGTYEKVSRYIALTEFARNKFIEGGLPKESLVVKPNFLPSIPTVGKGSGDYIVYVGRLSEEKGIRFLLGALREIPGLRLKVLGDGPLRKELEKYCELHSLAVDFLGFCNKEIILKIVGDAKLQVIPSIWYEGFPMVALEAMACGTPLLVSKIGSLEEIVVPGETGFHFEPGSVSSLVDALRITLKSPDLSTMRLNARHRFLMNFTSEINLKKLFKIYQDAINSQ